MSLLSALPKGDALGVPLFGAYKGAGPSLSLGGGALLAFVALAARLPVVRRRLQAAIATYGLLAASALLVLISGGQIELHFYFFVMMSVIVLYQDWLLIFDVPHAEAIGQPLTTYVATSHSSPSPACCISSTTSWISQKLKPVASRHFTTSTPAQTDTSTPATEAPQHLRS